MRTLLLAVLTVLSPVLPDAKGTAPVSTPAWDAQKAKKLYVAKCAGCHTLHKPSAYTRGEWKVWMDRMKKDVRLDPEQENAIRRYLSENAKKEKR